MINFMRSLGIIGWTVLSLTLLGCDDGVDSDKQAEQAYAGLDQAVVNSLQLGFKGFNEASSANISPQSATGLLSGTLTITGQVDQGASDNKGMRLRIGMVDYSDGDITLPERPTAQVTYETASDVSLQPELTLSLRNIPNGTFTGTLSGDFQMEGDLEGEVALDVTMSGDIEGDGTGGTQRAVGTTSVIGTATAQGGVFQIDITR